MSDNLSNLNRRRVPRFVVNELVAVKFGENAQQQVTGTCRDVSVGGMYFWVDHRFKPGTHLEFLLDLPSQTMLIQPIRLKGTGTVLRIETLPGQKQLGVGVTFNHVEVVAHA